jgi:CheY-like chemotaxis protein
VDDDPEFVETTRIILEANGYTARTAANGEEARAWLEKELPDVVLLDVMMRTKGEGIWFSQKFRTDERLRGIPILMITAVNRESDTRTMRIDPDTDGDFLPVDGFLEKPVEPADLLREVARLTAR